MNAFEEVPVNLATALARALTQPGRRVQRIVLTEGQFWLKRTEQPSLRMRLQKGNPHRGFAVERHALHVLAAAGQPVPALVDEGPDHIVLADAGPTLARLVTDAVVDPAERAAAFAAAGRALARLHAAGFAHGRPALRDICWDGQTARFIDLEQFHDRQARPVWRAIDLIVFVHSGFAVLPEGTADLNLALAAYRGVGGDAAWNRARRLARWLAWAGPLARLVLHWNPVARDWRAVPLTLAFFGR